MVFIFKTYRSYSSPRLPFLKWRWTRRISAQLSLVCHDYDISTYKEGIKNWTDLELENQAGMWAVVTQKAGCRLLPLPCVCHFSTFPAQQLCIEVDRHSSERQAHVRCTGETDLREFLTNSASKHVISLLDEWGGITGSNTDLCLLFFLTVSQKMSLVKRKQKRMPTSHCWMRLCLCIGGTVTKKCTQAATSIQGGESISSSLITPTLCGGPSQSTTESTILDKAGVTESGV